MSERRDCPGSEGGKHLFEHYYDFEFGGAIYACQFCGKEIVVEEEEGEEER